MEIVKKNLLSIIFGVIALAALVAMAFPIGGMYADTQAEIDARKKDSDSLTALKNAKRSWPLNPEDTVQPVKVDRFPNGDILREGERIRLEVQAQAVRMKSDTAERNKHEPLLPKAVGHYSENRFDFRTAYLAMQDTFLKQLAAGSTDPLKAKDVMPMLPPTPEDIKAAADNLYTTTAAPKIITVAGKEVNLGTVVDEWKAAAALLPTKLREDRANQTRIWVEKDAISVSKAMAPTNVAGPREEDIWCAQNMVWVQGDLIAAMIDINARSKNVKDAPIKRLVKLDVPDTVAQYVFSQSGSQGMGGPPAASNSNEEPGKAYARSVTGRVCNPMYDVIQFSMELDIDGRLLPEILAKLQAGRLITITQVNTRVADAAPLLEDGYIFGDAPLTHVSLQGEELFLRDWTVPLMPDEFRKSMQIQLPVAPGR